MTILKTQTFSTSRTLAIFVNKNNIARENILVITNGPTGSREDYTIFFYGDSEVKEEIPGFFE